MKQSQSKQIIEYMKEHGSITSLEAVRHIGCLRLSSRIFDLREAGYAISTYMEVVPTRNGGKTTVAVYRLMEE